ncbi:golgi family transport complex component cog5 [Ophiostoma piceae UAMH 11346]|uniref:Conserved oligomeric Golgi complex subunit 5 n=1 Tax=Ophiostoma piceae (strain UAMH 11346) TaxID=1262450 RepID=S3CUK3_OPHP1|nr:golgi family transport complex component cog5 [Ophiostoma piceae UAMH 11346]
MDTEEPSYIDYEAFLAPGFTAAAFANQLVVATNDPNDTPLDLNTPLSRVLFDIQEVDSHIDLLTAREATPLLNHTQSQTETSSHLIQTLDPQVQSLNESYRQLERQVLQKHAEADEVRQVTQRLWETLRLGRAVGRCLQLGRQLELQHTEAAPAAGAGDHNALVRCAHTILGIREITGSDEGRGLDKVDAIRTLQDGVVSPTEKTVRETSDRLVKEFSLSDSLTFSQGEEAKAKTVSALTTLYLLSPVSLATATPWTPTLMIQSLEGFLRVTLQSSLTALARSLAALPTLERTLAEVSARCQNVVALEQLLAATKAPRLASAAAKDSTLLQPLLAKLETGSLPSFFWRTLASHLSPRVQDIMTRGGVQSRTLRSNKTSVGDAIRECVLRGMQTSESTSVTSVGSGSNWDREIAVMVGSVTGHLGR